MGGKSGLGILLELPTGDPAFFAGIRNPFIAEPPGCPGAAGIVDPEMLAAMGGDFQIISLFFQGADSVEDSGPGWPELDFI